MTSPGIMGQRHPGRLRPPVDTRCTMHVTEKQQLSWSGDRSLRANIITERENNMSAKCLSLLPFTGCEYATANLYWSLCRDDEQRHTRVRVALFKCQSFSVRMRKQQTLF